MSAKPKVYQGVRVKTTVRELLQQRRALQAENGASEFQECRMQLSDPSPTCSERYYDFEASCSADSYHQISHFPNYPSQGDSLSFLDQLFPDTYLPSDCLADSNFNFLQSSSSPCALEGNNQLAPSYQQSMAPESLIGSDDMSNSFEYSPTYQDMPYTYQNHNAYYQDLGSCTFANVDTYYQHNVANCYCVYCHSMEHQEKLLEPYSYLNTRSVGILEYFPSSTVSEDSLPREMTAHEVLQLR